MCRTIRKFKCGTCAACYSSKRNALAIRLKEHYQGILRHYDENCYAVLFGMLTFTDENLPRPDFTKDVVTEWTKPIQLYLKRLNKLYPFLKFDYYIGAEYSPKGRFHCHPIWFVTPRESVSCKYNTKRLKDRYSQFLKVLADTKKYTLKLLHSDSKKRKETYVVNAFTKYVHDLLLANYTLGLSECKPVESSRAIVYVTKYVTKSRNEFFRRRSYISLDSQMETSKFRLIDDPVYLNRKVRQYYKDIYKSYLISRGIGDYFYETPQWFRLLRNFKIDEEIYQLDQNTAIKVLVPSPLKWFDCDYQFKNRGYSLPLKYRQHLYDLLAPKEINGIPNEQRMIISTAGRDKLDVAYLKHIISLCQSNNIDYVLVDTGTAVPDIRLTTPGAYDRLNAMQMKQYDDIKAFKERMLWQENSEN